MFFYLLLISLLGNAFISAENTVKYKCASELKIARCYYQYTNNSEIINFVKPCGSGKKCVKVKDLRTDSNEYNCIKNDVDDMLQEGDSCVSLNECESRICLKGKCSYLENYFVKCGGDYHCGLNSYCNSVCEPIIENGHKCKILGSCGVGAECGSKKDSQGKDNKCYELYSFSVGEEASGSYFCNTGYLYKSKCASAKRKNDVCDDKHQCEYEVNDGSSIDTIKVNCVTDNEGAYKCPLGSDSDEWRNYVDLYLKKVKKFNTKGVKITNVNKYHLNDKELIEAYGKYKYNHKLYKNPKDDNEKCLNQYWYQVVESGKNLKYSLMNIIVALSLFLL